MTSAGSAHNSAPIAGIIVMAVGAGLLVAAIVADNNWFEDHSLSSYCTRSAATPVLVPLTRVLLAAAGIALVTVARPRIVAWIARRDPRLMLRTSLGLVLAITLSLVASDLLLRLREARKDWDSDPVMPPLTIDSMGNVTPLASRTKDVTFGARTVRYTIDAEGRRTAGPDAIFDANVPTLVFAGESIAFGWGVAYEKSYPALVSAKLGLQAANIAVAGCANDQAYLRTEQAIFTLAHPVAVVTLANYLQLERNLRGGRDHLVLSADGHLTVEAASGSVWETSPLRRLLPFHSADAVALTREIFAATARVARSRGAIPVFLWTNYGPPCRVDEGGGSRLERRLFADLDVVVVRVDITRDQTINQSDLHPNEQGHEAIANALVETLRASW